MSSHIHVPGTFDKFTNLGAVTFNTVLDSIIADVAAAIAAGTANGWTLHDDQRTLAGHGGIYAIPVCYAGFAGGGSGYGFAISAGATAINANANPSTRLLAHWKPGLTEINTSSGFPNWTPSGTWGVVSAVGSASAATLAVAWPNGAVTTPAAGSNGRCLVEKAAGYVVLRCESTQKVFFVQIIRPRSYGDALRCRVWETWDAATHTGTNPSNMEILRAYNAQTADGTGAVKYVLFLLPDTFVLYAGRGDDNLTTNYADLFYAGNLISSRVGDTNALVVACTNQELTAWGPDGSSGVAVVNGCDGGAQILRDYAGTRVWRGCDNTTYDMLDQAEVIVSIRPRASSYLDAPNRRLLDTNQRCRMVALDVRAVPPRAWTETNLVDDRRGEIRHIRVPAGNPSWTFLQTFGPSSDDGKTYIMLRCAYANVRTTADTQTSMDVGATAVSVSGFCFRPAGAAGTRDEIAVNSISGVLQMRWFMLPIDL